MDTHEVIEISDTSSDESSRHPTIDKVIPISGSCKEPMWFPGLRRIRSGNSEERYELPMIFRCQACFDYYMSYHGRIPDSSRHDSLAHFKGPGVHESRGLPFINPVPANCQCPEVCRVRPNTVRCDNCFNYYMDFLGRLPDLDPLGGLLSCERFHSSETEELGPVESVHQ